MESFADVFGYVKKLCSESITDVSYNLWIKPVEPMDFENDTAILFVKEDFHKGILNDKYMRLLKDSFREVMGYDVDIKILSEKDTGTPDDTYVAPEDEEEAHTIDFERFDKKYEYTFDTFIVGKSNEFAHAACRAVAQNQNTKFNNPLFIYGPSGLGKTHLMLAITNYVKEKNPEKRIVFENSECFTNELVNSLKKSRNLDDFHLKYRNADILLLDDIQFIAGKESTQEEFFHTFNELYQQGKQIILTSDRPPKDIKTLEERIRNRFESGLMADISFPDYETRLAIIKRKAEMLKLDMPDEVAAYIAKRLKSDIRQLEGTVKKMKANQLFTGAHPSIAIAQNVIRDVLNDSQPEPVTVEKIINEVSKTFGVSEDDIRSKKKNAQISLARQTAIYIVRQITQMSLEAIGKEFNGRDHATMVYTIKKVEKSMTTDTHYREIIEDTIKNIKARV